MIRKLLATSDDWTITVLRLVMGVIYFAHGAQKALGWFGGYGFSGTMGWFTQQMHIPTVFAFLAICGEFLGGIGLIVGALGRVAAFGIACNMAAPVLMVHLPNGLFMNWTGQQKGEGFEFHLLALSIAAVLMVRGSGAFSVDHALGCQSEASTAASRKNKQEEDEAVKECEIH
jgi:putative oxidoreductase